MKLTIVTDIPSRKGVPNKYLPVLESFVKENKTGTCAVLEDVPANRAAYLKTIRCSNELPLNIVSRGGQVYLERVETFENVKQ